jgi:ATP-dependent Lon protease
MKKFNIIFSVNEKGYSDDEDDDSFDSEDEDYETENEDDDISDSEDSDSSEEEEEEEEQEEEEEEEEEIKNNCGEENKMVVKNIIDKVKTLKKSGVDDTEITDEQILKQLNNIKSKMKNPLIIKCIKECKQEIKNQIAKKERKIEKEKERNERIFRKIIKNKNMLNDYNYFIKLDSEEQKCIIKKIKEINNITKIDKPYRLSLIESSIPAIFKVTAMKKMAILRNMEPGSGEYCKIKNWVDTFMQIPFNKTDKLPICIGDGIDKCHEFMENAQKTLDSAVYGLNDAKMQIMQILGQLIMNPSSIGTAIAIHGPPGSGKTSLVKEGISKILNRPFAFIALGGATDSSFLEGHSYTYEGSTWGKIVQILIDSKSMNPVIYFDELDKISDTPKGEEIASILTHLTDTSQNSQFHDKYFSEIDFDLSKCIFIFSYNDESKVNPILKDRMYRISTKGYDIQQKTIICNQYLLPNIRKQVAFDNGMVTIPDNTIKHIIENYCLNESGVRNLKRCMEIIHTKLNLFRLMKPDNNLFGKDLALKVSFPFTVSIDIVDKLLKRDENTNIYKNMYI